MIVLDALRRCELALYERMGAAERRPWGLLFYNRENPISHDSNHAVILDPLAMDDAALAAALDEIEAFYRAYGVEPRLYHALAPGEGARLAPLLAARGYVSEPAILRGFCWQAPPRQAPHPALEVRRVAALDEAIRGLIHSDGPCPWTEGAIAHQLPRDDYRLFVGYVGDTPATMGSLADYADAAQPGGGLTRVDDVQTDPRYRGHGYARELLRVMVNDHAARSTHALYLWAENPTAIRIYEQTGFVEFPVAADYAAAYLPAAAAHSPNADSSGVAGAPGPAT